MEASCGMRVYFHFFHVAGLCPAPSRFAPRGKSKGSLAYVGAQINTTAKAFMAAGLALLFENELLCPGSLQAPSLYLTKCFISTGIRYTEILRNRVVSSIIAAGEIGPCF